MSWNDEWIAGQDYPSWADNDVYKKTISSGYLLEGETPRKAYRRVTETVAQRLGKPHMSDVFFEYIWNGWLCLASPVLSNTGTTRGLPISCYGIDVADSIHDIGNKNTELMLLAQRGGGVGIGTNMIRPAGSKITGNGTSDGVIPFTKIYDSTILATNQGSVRRGAASVNLNVEHGDFDDWLHIREPKGDINRQSLNLHHAAVIGDKFMRKLEAGDPKAKKRWINILKTRVKTGEPYMLFKGNVNKANPEAYKNNGLKVHMTNICSEIVLHTDENHSFVCCLSSLNLSRYDEWKNTNLVYDATYFLDGVMEEFIQRAKGLVGFENAVRSAQKGRAIGLGVLGWHTFLQQRGIPFADMLATYATREIFSKIKTETEKASRDMAVEYGEPLWCRDTGFRNTHLRAVAPTTSNSKLAGGVSSGIEPEIANVYTEGGKFTFIRKNKVLELFLKEKGLNTSDIWRQILEDEGSVQSVDALEGVTVGEHEVPIKEVFLTAKEINQMDLIKQAGVRQQYVDQSCSLNLFFTKAAPPKFISEVHMEAWRQGIKSLYYFRSQSPLRGDIGGLYETCSHCEG